MDPISLEYERGVKDEAKLFSLNRLKYKIDIKLGKTGYNRLGGKNKEFSSGHNFEVSIRNLCGIVCSQGYRYQEFRRQVCAGMLIWGSPAYIQCSKHEAE